VTDNKSIIGFNVSYLFENDEMIQENIEGLKKLAESGGIYPPETTYIPFEKVADAHKLIESGNSRGKIILTV
jgi:NADPH:quinone reductase-like Zn-dependent oxidoreductase